MIQQGLACHKTNQPTNHFFIGLLFLSMYLDYCNTILFLTPDNTFLIFNAFFIVKLLAKHLHYIIALSCQ